MSNALQLLPVGIIVFYVFIVGLCIGSLLNVIALRGLSGEDVVFARSKCPKCSNQLAWYMNIPLFSYLFLRGKCGFCKEKISPQYPIVEFITGCLFVFSYFQFGISLKFLFACIILSTFIVLSLTDILETVVLDFHTYFLALVGLIYSALKLGDINFIGALIGAISSFVLMEALARIGKPFLGLRIFGEGDSLIAIGLGAIFGIKGFVVILALSFIIQTILSIPFLIKKAFDNKKKKLGIAYIFVVFFLLTSITLNYFNILVGTIYYLIYLLVLIFTMLWSFVVIISDIKNRKDEFIKENSKDELNEDKNPFCLLPFGPALIISATLCLFYMNEIKVCINNFLY